MEGFLGVILNKLLDFITFISHAAIVLSRNFVLLVFILVFLYGIFRLFYVGWKKLRGHGALREPPGSVPEDDSKSGGG